MTKIKQFFIATTSILIIIQIIKVIFQSLLKIQYINNNVSLEIIYFLIITGLILLFYYVILSFQKLIISNGEFVVSFTSFPRIIFEYISIILSQVLIYFLFVIIFFIIYWFINRTLGNFFQIETILKTKLIQKVISLFGYIWIFPFMYIVPIISIKRTKYKTKEIRKQSLIIIKENKILSFLLYFGLLVVNIILPLVILDIPNAQILRNSIISVYLILYHIVITSVYCRSFHK